MTRFTASPLQACHMAAVCIIDNTSAILSVWCQTPPRTGDILLRPHLRFVPRPPRFPCHLCLPRGVLQRPPSLAIPGSLAYSPSALHTPLSSSFSTSDIGTPTSSIHLVDNTGAGSSSQAPAPALWAPNPKAGQGVLKLPSTKRRHKHAIACLFCRERKIACKAPPVGSADPTCK